MNNYFITGLTRSRSAWLSVFLTYGDSFCFHDGVKYCNTSEEYKRLIEGRKEKYVGDSDTGLVLVFDEIMKHFPDGKIIVIDRNLKDSTNDMMEAFNMPVHIASKLNSYCYEQLQKIKSDYDPLVIKFEDLNKRTTCEKLWKYIFPMTMFPSDRWEFLDEFKISIHWQKYIKNHLKRKTGKFLETAILKAFRGRILC